SVIGTPPMSYLASWRMQVAAQRLRECRRSVAQVAAEVGYESEAAFIRAFQREMGISPARWRRGESERDAEPALASWRREGPLASDEAEEEPGDLAHLALLGAFGDPVPTVVPVDVSERLVPRVAEAAMHLHGEVGRLAAQAIGPVVAHRHLVRQSARDLGLGHAVHLPGGLADQQPQHLGLGRELHDGELDALVGGERLAEGLALARPGDAL